MILDSSALIAILQQEADAQTYAQALDGAKLLRLSAPTYLETAMVHSSRFGSDAISELDELVARIGIEILPFSHQGAQVAALAFLKYGKGQGHPAQLNFGDCISYATSKVEAMPLLFKGDDFRLTDVECAI